MLAFNNIYNGDCRELLKQLDNESIDMILTSPPYDDMREYDNCTWNFEIFKEVANELKRVLKTGGVIIWVVGDQTKNGSETGTSFRQALYFKEIGLNIHDTMLYRKLNFIPLTHNRYEQEFEYMFCFSKGKPKTFNPIMVKSKWGGTENWGTSKVPYADNTFKIKEKSVVNEFKQKGNIFEYHTGKIVSNGSQHPAVFPQQLAIDQIMSWSNEGDVVCDPFIGSGTTAVACKNLKRKYIGFEISEKYFKIAKDRLNGINKKGETNLFETDFENL